MLVTNRKNQNGHPLPDVERDEMNAAGWGKDRWKKEQPPCPDDDHNSRYMIDPRGSVTTDRD